MTIAQVPDAVLARSCIFLVDLAVFVYSRMLKTIDVSFFLKLFRDKHCMFY